MPHPSLGGTAGGWRRIALALCVLTTVGAIAPSRSVAQDPCPRLQTLPFERVGDDDRMDWLARGFPELMGLVLGRACLEGVEPPKALPRTQLRHGSVPDREKGSRRSKEDAPDFILTGSWFVDGPEVVVEALLLRFADERWMAVANWRGPIAEILAAPAKLARTHFEQLGLPYDEASLADLALGLPRGLAAAASLFRGLAARDAGAHDAARAFFLESVAAEPGFTRARREAFRATLLLGQEAEAAAFARESAQRLERSDPSHALEFLWEASRLAADDPPAVSLELLERIDRIALEHERATGETAALRARLLEQITVLADAAVGRSGPELLFRAEDRWRIWVADIDGELERRARQGGLQWARRDGRWAAIPVPEPTAAMWRVRALLELARRLARAGRIEEALGRYRQIVEEYAFLEPTGLFGAATGFYWTSGIRLEAHFMMLWHLKQSGRLVSDPTLHPSLNTLRDREPFVRDYSDPAPDRRARVWSRRADGGHEYFDFAAPAGRQFDRVRVETRVSGAAWLDVDLPDAQGWPPQFGFSRRLDMRRLARGESSKSYDLPRGTVLVSVSVLWGQRWARSSGDALTAARDGNDIAWLKVTFETSPAAVVAARIPAEPNREADGKIFAHHAGKWGWETGKVVRASEDPPAASRSPGFLEKAQLAFQVAGDLLLAGEDGSRGPKLPRQINTLEAESGPQLVRAHGGALALLWRYGPRGGRAERWLASTKDFSQWEVPRRVVMAAQGQGGPETDAAGPVAPVPGGYVMLLGGGKTRFSPDLAQWGPARATFAADGSWKALASTDDGRLWAVLTQSEDREVPPGGRPAPGLGFYRTADGRTFEKATAILASTSLDGASWTEPSLLRRGAEPSGLWAFPAGRDRIAVVAGYGSLELAVTVFAGGDSTAVPVATPVRLPTNGPDAVFFIREGKVWCARVVHDFATQESVVLFAGSGALFDKIAEAAR